LSAIILGMYRNGPTAVWVGVRSSGPQPSDELRAWWGGKPTLGKDAAWGPDRGPYVMLCVDLVGLAYVNQDEGHLAGDQLIAQLYEKLVASAGPGRIHLWGAEYYLVWHGRDAAFADATVAALGTDPAWCDRVHGDLLEAPTGAGLVNRLKHAGWPPAVGIRDLRTVPLLAQHAGLVSDEPARPWREEPWLRPVPAGETLDARFPRRPPPPVPTRLGDLPEKRPNAELRELIHRDTSADGPYIALVLGGTPYPWSQAYDDQHPDGLLRNRIAQVLHNCIGPGRYYTTRRIIVLWHAGEAHHAEHAVAVVNADPVVRPFLYGHLVQEHRPRLGQVLRKLEGAPHRPAAPIVDLRDATPLVRAEHRGRPGTRHDWGIG
jgi:hypothetical protein